MSRFAPFPERRPHVVWPAMAASVDLEPRRSAGPLELWEQETELFPGETVLRDLGLTVSAAGATLILARYQTVRVAVQAVAGDPTTHSMTIEIDAARAYLGRVPSDRIERRWLGSAIGSIGADGLPGAATVSRLAAAAAAAQRAGDRHGAWALWRTGWRIARDRGLDRQAARIARSVAGAAAADGGHRSARMWNRRARVLEMRVGS